MDKITAIAAIARNLKDLIIDANPASISNATGTVFMDFLELIHPLADQLAGKAAYIYDGGGAGQQRISTGFLTATNRVVFGRTFTTAPSTNSDVLMFSHWDKDDYDNALERLIGKARLVHLEEKVATMELVGSQYAYLVPSGFEYISALRIVPSGGDLDYEADDEVNRIFEIHPRNFTIEPNAGGSFLIVIDPRKVSIDAVLNQEWVHIIGQAPPDIAATDNADIPDGLEEFLINGACMLLASQRISGKANDEWVAKFLMYRDEQRTLEEYIHRPRYGKRVGG